MFCIPIGPEWQAHRAKICKEKQNRPLPRGRILKMEFSNKDLKLPSANIGQEMLLNRCFGRGIWIFQTNQRNLQWHCPSKKANRQTDLNSIQIVHGLLLFFVTLRPQQLAGSIKRILEFFCAKPTLSYLYLHQTVLSGHPSLQGPSHTIAAYSQYNPAISL